MTSGMRLRVPGFLCSRPHPQAIVFPLVQSLGGGGSQLGWLRRKPGTLCIVWSTKYFQRTKNKRFYACFFLFFHIWKHSTMKNMTSLLLTNVDVSRGRTRRLRMMFSFTSINMGFFMIRVFYSNLDQWMKNSVLRIHDILGWIRIRISGSMPLTDGSGFGSRYFCHWPSRGLEKTKFCTHFFLLFTFWSYFYIIFHG